MYEAWKADSRALLPYDDDQARKDAETIDAKVLSNRKPPYSIAGGLYDALKATNGDVLKVENSAAAAAAELFLATEGIDIHPAAAVALASLIAEVEAGNIDPKATIMLNITGGGERRATEGKQLWYLKPSIVFDLNPNEAEVVSKVEKLFQ
jgi:cysteate synthase